MVSTVRFKAFIPLTTHWDVFEAGNYHTPQTLSDPVRQREMAVNAGIVSALDSWGEGRKGSAARESALDTKATYLRAWLCRNLGIQMDPSDRMALIDESDPEQPKSHYRAFITVGKETEKIKLWLRKAYISNGIAALQQAFESAWPEIAKGNRPWLLINTAPTREQLNEITAQMRLYSPRMTVPVVPQFYTKADSFYLAGFRKISERP